MRDDHRIRVDRHCGVAGPFVQIEQQYVDGPVDVGARSSSGMPKF
jgi:hypothetical protein